MRKFWFITILMATVLSAATSGIIPSGEAFIRNQQERDSVLIGDRLSYGVLLKDIADGSGLALPDFQQGFVQGIEVLGPWQLDTVKTTRGKKGHSLMDIEAVTEITSFDEGTYDLPAVRVVRQSATGKLDTLLFSGKILSVKTMPVDTATFTPHDIRGQMRYPLTFREILPWILGVAILAALAFIAVRVVKSRREKLGLEPVPDEPTHITALRRLDALRGNKYWAPEKQKFFYSSVTDTLRSYMEARWGFGAMEMTTDEIFDALKDKGLPKDLYDETEQLFETSDFVKYAKHTVSDEENAKAVPLAVRFVTSTYEKEVEKEAGDVL